MLLFLFRIPVPDDDPFLHLLPGTLALSMPPFRTWRTNDDHVLVILNKRFVVQFDDDLFPVFGILDGIALNPVHRNISQKVIE